ncbi:AAA family ATPase [Methanomassiliicoccales archaeon LGM-RCC1]|nr:AAA family ATPase [Methanomassiliicoccales archaeon LGM-RCC1]
MRISRVNIASFGKLRDRTFELDPKLNVFYGPNESGKTTTMEFIRSVLVPSNGRKLYPERNKRDEGYIEYTEDDVQCKAELGSAQGIPKCLVGMEPELYRNIFAMNTSGLDNQVPLSSGDIRSRFLTIPGGEEMPKVIDSLEDEVASLLGKTSSSPSKVNGLQDSEQEVMESISSMRSNAESYSALTEKKERLESELEAINKENSSAIENNQLYAKIESQKGAYSSLQQNRQRKKELSASKLPTPEDIREHDRLVSDSQIKKGTFSSFEESRRAAVAELGSDEKTVREQIPLMRELISKRPEYDARLNRPAPVNTTVPIVRIIVSLLLIAVAVVALIIPGLDDIVRYAVAGAMVAGIIVFLLFTRKLEPAVDYGNLEWIEAYERDVTSEARLFGGSLGSVHSDLQHFEQLIRKIDDLDRTSIKRNELHGQSMQAENNLLRFLSAYGGEQGYRTAVSNADEMKKVDANISMLCNNIRTAGFDPDQPLPVVEKIYLDTTLQTSIASELGTVEEKMKAVLDTAELDALIDRSYAIHDEMEMALREGATAVLASAIVQEACTELYENVHPEVVTTADSYLSLMTKGTCRLDLDPRNTDLSVISNGEAKGPRQWSTGLRAQILLSLKLAVAREMGDGDIPMILDDVLLPFDSERKEGAMEALMQVSSDMQVLLFTCDDDIAEMAERIDGCNLIRM